MNKIIRSNIFFLIILTISILAIYAKSISFGFTELDDDTLIINNINYISDISSIPKHFTTDCYYIHDFQYYRPILSISFSIEAILFGNNPKIYHISNIILFILSLFLIFLLLAKLKFNQNIVKFICLLMAIHPIFTSCAVWIPARNDTLLLIFLMLSFINFINYLEKDRIQHLILYILFFSMALFTKETTVILIPLYGLFIYCFDLNISKEKVIKIFLILLPIVIVYFVLRSIAVPDVSIKEYLINWQKYSANIIKGMMVYIDNFIEPGYIPIMLYNIKLNFKVIIINISVLSSLGFVYYKKIINRKIILFGIIWFIVCLLPTFFTIEYLFLTHRVIISSVGIIMVLSLILDKFVLKYPVIQKYLIVFSIVLAIIFSSFSYIESDKYKNADKFWTNAYIDAKEYHVVYFSLSKRYSLYKDYQKARKMIEKAIELSPKTTYFIELVKISFLINKNLEAAETNYLKILDAVNGNNFLCLFELSRIYYLKNDIKNAIEYAQKATDLKKYDILCLGNLAKFYTMNGEYKKSIDTSLRLLELDKENKGYYYYNISLLYKDLNDKQESLNYIKKAISASPYNKEYKKILEELI
ncbi:MAG: DUF3808 domain-containing protein [Endomicrobiaceae bacterium]|nr:DUF3808 domain-containing protein [Endomicrobiaceae bacterium]